MAYDGRGLLSTCLAFRTREICGLGGTRSGKGNRSRQRFWNEGSSFLAFVDTAFTDVCTCSHLNRSPGDDGNYENPIARLCQRYPAILSDHFL